MQKLESVAVKLSELVDLIRGMADNTSQTQNFAPNAAASVAAKTIPPLVAVQPPAAADVKVPNKAPARSIAEEATLGALMDKLLEAPTPPAASKRYAAPERPAQLEPAAQQQLAPQPAPLPAFSTRPHADIAALTAPIPQPVAARAPERQENIAQAAPALITAPAQKAAGASDFYAALAAMQQLTDTRRAEIKPAPKPAGSDHRSAGATPQAATPQAAMPTPPEAQRPAAPAVQQSAQAPVALTTRAPEAPSTPLENPAAALEAAKNLEKLLTAMHARKTSAAAAAQNRRVSEAQASEPVAKETKIAPAAPTPAPVSTAIPVAISAEPSETAPRIAVPIVHAHSIATSEMPSEAAIAVKSPEASPIESRRIEMKQPERRADVKPEALEASTKAEERVTFVEAARRLAQERAPRLVAASHVDNLEPAPVQVEPPKNAQRPTLGPKIVELQAPAETAQKAKQRSLWSDFVVAHRMKAAGFAVLAVGAGYLAMAPRGGDLRPLTDMMQDMRAKLNTIDGFASRDEVAVLRRSVGDVKSELAELGASTATAVADISARLDKLDRSNFTGSLRESGTPGAKPAARATERRPPVAATVSPKIVTSVKSVPAPPTTALNQGFTLQTPLYLGANVPSTEVSSVPATAPAPTSALQRASVNSQGYVVREVYDGAAVVENAFGRRKIAVGDLLPGAGKVEAIEMRGRQWVVVTSNGLISPPLN